MPSNPREVMAFRTDGFGHRSQVPDFVSEMDLFWNVPTNETTFSRTFRKREKVTYSGERPSKSHCVTDGGLYFTGRKDSSISSLTFPPHAWRV
jgi:hypothetical protein